MLQGKGARVAGQLRALQHLTRQRRGGSWRSLLLHDIQGRSVQHSWRAQQHMPNMQSGAHQQADVRVSGRLLGQAVPALVFSERHGQLRRQTIILAQPWHRAGTSCVDRLLCPMLSLLIKMPSCSRGCSQPSFSVRVQRCGLLSRLINVLFKSTKMVKSN
jgi:hypothetical protein